MEHKHIPKAYSEASKGVKGEWRKGILSFVKCFVQQPNQNSNLHSEAASISGVTWLFKHPESCLILQLLWGVYLKLLAKILYELTESLLSANFNSETIVCVWGDYKEDKYFIFEL